MNINSRTQLKLGNHVQEIDVEALFVPSNSNSEIFADESFRRYRTIMSGVDTITDCSYQNGQKVRIAYLRIYENVEMLFRRIIYRDPGFIVVTNCDREQYLISFPCICRTFDRFNRIITEESCHTEVSERSIIVYGSPRRVCEINIYSATDIICQGTAPLSNLEQRQFAIYGRHNITPFLLGKYLIDGKIYDPRTCARVQGRRI